MEAHEGRCRVSGKSEDRCAPALGGLFIRNCGKCCWFTRFHMDPAEVYRPLKIVFDNWFQQVCGTHGRPTGRQNDICRIKTLFDLGGVILNTTTENRMRNAAGQVANDLTRTCHGQCPDPPHDNQGPRGLFAVRGDWCPKLRPMTRLKSLRHRAGQ
jgi:hypothetical protein